jgi:hypothetical protein
MVTRAADEAKLQSNLAYLPSKFPTSGNTLASLLKFNINGKKTRYLMYIDHVWNQNNTLTLLEPYQRYETSM